MQQEPYQPYRNATDPGWFGTWPLFFIFIPVWYWRQILFFAHYLQNIYKCGIKSLSCQLKDWFRPHVCILIFYVFLQRWYLCCQLKDCKLDHHTCAQQCTTQPGRGIESHKLKWTKALLMLTIEPNHNQTYVSFIICM